MPNAGFGIVVIVLGLPLYLFWNRPAAVAV